VCGGANWKSQKMKYIKFFLKVIATLSVVAFVLLFLLFDYMTNHQIFYQTAEIFRKWVKPELYDGTYGMYWPVEGGSPFKVVAEIEFEGRKYEGSSTVRCYQYRNYTDLSNHEFHWAPHISVVLIPLKGGGLISSRNPRYCDRLDGPLNEPLAYNNYSFQYLDDREHPTFIGEYSSAVMELGNMAILSDPKALDPREFNIRVFPIDDATVSYTNREDTKYRFLFGKSKPYKEAQITKQAMTFSGLSGYLYFESEWRRDPELVEFLKDKTEPTLVPEHLMEDVRGSPKGLPSLEEQVADFLSKKNLEPVHLNYNQIMETWFRLSGEREWTLDFDSIGVKRAFRRGCDDNFQNCSIIPVGRKAAEFDQVRVGDHLFDASSQPAIYLSSDQIIVQLTRPHTFSTYLM